MIIKVAIQDNDPGCQSVMQPAVILARRSEPLHLVLQLSRTSNAGTTQLLMLGSAHFAAERRQLRAQLSEGSDLGAASLGGWCSFDFLCMRSSGRHVYHSHCPCLCPCYSPSHGRLTCTPSVQATQSWCFVPGCRLHAMVSTTLQLLTYDFMILPCICRMRCGTIA